VAVDVIKKALEKDEKARSTGQELGLIHSMKRLDSILNNERPTQEIDIDKLTDRVAKMEEDLSEGTEEKEPQIEDKGEGVVELQVPESSDNEDVEEPITIVQEVKAADKKKVVAEIELHESDSEEEETQMLSGKDLQQTGSEQQGRQWYKPNWK